MRPPDDARGSATDPRLSRAASLTYWTFPSLFCLWLYWYGLLSWFAQDDFAWLGLRAQVHSWREFWEAMVTPMAQGTIRPWSERGFFMLFSWLFGLDALPFRIWVFLTQFASLALLASITSKLTGSRIAGFLAPLLWTANSVLAVAMSWTSTYNQILSGFFILLAFRVFLRYCETGRRRDYALQFGIFLIGFGALEINIVYPAIAAAYAIGCAPWRLLSTIPMFGVSAGYAVLHRSMAPGHTAGVYATHFDISILHTLGTYALWALGPSRLTIIRPKWSALAPYAAAVLLAALLGFAGWMTWKGGSRCRRWLPAFFLAWFVIVLGPILPLRDHISEYYLTLPVAGIAALAAWGLAVAWRSSWIWRAVAAAVAVLYLASSIPVARASAKWYYDRSGSVRRLVLGVVRAHELHPGKSILLTGVQTELFWAGVYDRPFRLLGIEGVYLAPGAERSINAHPEVGEMADYIFPAEIVAAAIDRQQAVVYSAAGPLLRNITKEYRDGTAAAITAGPARRLDAGNPLFAHQLGPGWYEPDSGSRWMSKRAVVTLGGPRKPSDKLYISGFCPPQQFEHGNVGIRVQADGKLVGSTVLRPGQGSFDLVWALPLELTGTNSILIDIEVERTIVPPGDGRELGLAFGSFAVRP